MAGRCCLLAAAAAVASLAVFPGSSDAQAYVRLMRENEERKRAGVAAAAAIASSRGRAGGGVARARGGGGAVGSGWGGGSGAAAAGAASAGGQVEVLPRGGLGSAAQPAQQSPSSAWTPPAGDPYTVATARFQAAEKLSPFTYLEHQALKCPPTFALASSATHPTLLVDTAACFDYCAAREECGYIYVAGGTSTATAAAAAPGVGGSPGPFFCELYSRCNRMHLVPTADGGAGGKIYSLAARGVAEKIDGLWLVASDTDGGGGGGSGGKGVGGAVAATGWLPDDGTDPVLQELLAEVADMSVGSCSLDHVYNASDAPLEAQMTREEWDVIHDSAPMLVRTVHGKGRDVRLHKATLLKYFGSVLTKAQSEASIAQFGPSDVAATTTMRDVLENPDVTQPRLGFDANMAKMLRHSTSYEQHMPPIISRSLGPPGMNAMDIFSIAPTKAGLPMHVHGEAWLHLLGGEKLWFFIEPEGLKPLKHIPGLHELTLRVPGRSVREILDVLRAVRASGSSTKMHACLQRSGDLMYVPALWWHMTLNIGEAAGFSFQRYHLNRQEVFSNMGSGTAHMRLAEQWEMENKLDDAEKELVEAIALEPLNWQFISVLMRVHVRNHKPAQARQILVDSAGKLMRLFEGGVLSRTDVDNILSMWLHSVRSAGGGQDLAVVIASTAEDLHAAAAAVGAV